MSYLPLSVVIRPRAYHIVVLVYTRAFGIDSYALPSLGNSFG